MTLMITLPPDIESRLKGEASRNGLDIEAYASKLIADRYPQQESSDGGPPMRGVFSVQSERPSLFAQAFTVKVEDLPKWTPQVVVSRRVLTEDDDA
jgi:hypothetical protein